MPRITSSTVFQTVRNAAISGTAIVLLVEEIRGQARLEILMALLSLIGGPAWLQSNTAIKNAAKATDGDERSAR